MPPSRWVLAIALAATACTAVPTPDRPTPSATKKPNGTKPTTGPGVKATATPGATGTAKPGATPGPSATATAGAQRRLAKPASGVRTIASSLAVDAAYAVGTGRGTIVSDQGGSMLAVGQAGAALVSNNGASIVSDYGGGLVSNNGGSIISNNGGAIVGKIRFQVLQAPAPAPPPLGTIAPAAGMAISVFDLATGQAQPLGVDDAGQPVFEVLTGAGGRFEVHPPASAANLVLHARLPGADAGDFRLRYNLVMPPVALASTLDEDTSKATYFLHRSLVRTFLVLTDPKPNPADTWIPFNQDPAERQKILDGRQALKTEAGRLGLDRLPIADRTRLAERMADALVARVDIGKAGIYRQPPPFTYEGPDERAFDAYMAVLKGYREALTTKLRSLQAAGEDPYAWLLARPYVVEAAAKRAEPFTFKKPGDFLDFLLETYIAEPGISPNESAGGLLNATTGDLEADPVLAQRFAAAALGTNAENARELYLRDGALTRELFALMAAAAPKP